MSSAIPPIHLGERHAPIPVGPLTGKRTALRRLLARSLATLNRTLDLLPPGRWLHRRIRRSLTLTDLQLPLRRGHHALNGLRIAFLSDIHAGSFMDASDLCAICERVAAAEPDLVLFGGDLVNTRERELLLFRQALPLLRPRLGMFAVPGNHDHFWGPDIGLWSAFLQELGVQVLLNRGVRVQHGEGSLWLCGVDDLTEGTPDLRAALLGRRTDEPAVLLSHHPDFFFEAAAADVELTLAGHTHGGQIRIGGRAPIHHSKFGYEQGWFEEAGCRLYVGRGVGVTVLPIRIDAPPEVPIVTLVRTPVPSRRVEQVVAAVRG
ncbi:MAG: metallophosphoesterase [Planctomycetes bacterium]|nr:metallophosphoesterase [Planctomycetota bacterium]